MKKYKAPFVKVTLYKVDDIVRTSLTDWGDDPYSFSGEPAATFVE